MAKARTSADEWCRLIDAAIAFKKMTPWQWMNDDDIFAVENPENGEIGYCCVMGAMGEHLALGVYLGNEGLESYYFLRESAPISSSESIMHTQKCLMVSYEDRRFLNADEHGLIRALGYRFRGKNAWPKFQRFDPGFYPWRLQAPDVRFLTVALEQALVICARARREALGSGSQGKRAYVLRKPRKQRGRIQWVDSSISPKLFRETRVPPVQMDAKRIRRLHDRMTERGGFVEFDYFYLPQPVQERPKDRPYFPVVYLFVDSDTGFILNTKIVKSLPAAEEVVEVFLGFLDEDGVLPLLLLVQNEHILESLKPVAGSLGIQLVYVESLSMLHEAKESMYQFWRKNV